MWLAGTESWEREIMRRRGRRSQAFTKVEPIPATDEAAKDVISLRTRAWIRRRRWKEAKALIARVEASGEQLAKPGAFVELLALRKEIHDSFNGIWFKPPLLGEAGCLADWPAAAAPAAAPAAGRALAAEAPRDPAQVPQWAEAPHLTGAHHTGAVNAVVVRGKPGCGAPDILDGALGKIVHMSMSGANATIKFDDPSCGQWAVQWPFIWAEASTPY